MRLAEDRLLEYRGYHGCKSECRIRLYEGEGKPPVVIATELDSNPGTSVTNRAEAIAHLMWQYLERPPAGMVFIENYPDRCFIGDRPMMRESFDLVSFEWGSGRPEKPVWRRISRSQVETILGTPVSK